MTGLADTTLPKWSLGYVYLPAFAGIAATSIIVASIGARLTHRLPVDTFRRIFIIFMLGLTFKMATSI